MILVDAGPLISLLDRKDRDHRACTRVLSQMAPPMVTTWPTLTEAMYLLGHRRGWEAQEKLWRIVLRGNLTIHALDRALLERTSELMAKYRSVPMDLADASLVATTEALDDHRIFTLDSDFSIYRLHGRTPFEVLP